ncbi:MAG: M23 family metallopeptidase [Ignavibacteriaceae bacterium]|nr:M23 family metallopeptidase [Ignavibacteriaceae bacterium]
MKFNFFKLLENFSIIIFQEGKSVGAKSIRFSGKKIIIYLILYTLFIGLFGFYFIYATPLERIFLPSWLNKTTIEEQQYEELSNKIIYLVKEVESLKSSNVKLKKAIQLGDSTLLKNTKKSGKVTDTKKKIPAEGNIIIVFQKLIDKYFSQTQSDDLYFIQPIKGFISRDYKPDQGHKGLDFVAKENTPVYASAGGYVVFANFTPQHGFIIIINHAHGYVSKYKHCSLLVKKEGETVKQGELIALSGNSGTDTSGPHLHFEIWKDGNPIDPRKVLLNF